jgi:hypothetical protein
MRTHDDLSRLCRPNSPAPRPSIPQILHPGCIMNNRAQYPHSDHDHGIPSKGENPRERRQWVRFVLPNLVTRLRWFNGTETVTHLVSLVNVSASGAAVIMDVKPPSDRPYMILFENGGDSTGPIPATLIAFETTDGGRYLAKFTFDQVQATRGFVHHQKERRAWQRVVPRERRACLSWQVGDDTFSVPGEMQNISGGGFAVQTDVTPPWKQAIWLSLGPAGEEAGPVECRLVGVRHDQAGKLIARFAFVDLCPLQLYQAAMEISK